MGDPPADRTRSHSVFVTSARGLIPPGPSATLVLVRHAESTWLVQRRFQGQRNPWLSERGRTQAEAVARRLADPSAAPPLAIPPGPPVAIWHSPLKRARDTAAVIGRRVPAKLVPDPRLTEIGQGEWETRTHRAVAAADGAMLDAWRRDPTKHVAPGGETLEAVGVRVGAALRDILASLADEAHHADQDAPGPWGLVVSHEGTLRIATLLLLGLPLSSFWEHPFDLCSITVFELVAGRAVLRSYNDTAHLADLAGPTIDRAGAL